MNISFTKKVTAKINLTPEQWQLYASSMDCSEAAEAMNRATEKAIESSASAWEALRKLSPVMRRYSSFGACDSEPIWVAEHILAKAFGEEE